MVSMRLWVPDVVFGYLFVDFGCPDVQKDMKIEAFLREGVGASEVDFCGHPRVIFCGQNASWGALVVFVQGFQASRL